ncbi:MAG TPA: glycosyltransferase 87 family protein [Chthoniobacterales bacterium]|nr:glycosyltransferase 87 family protein [Chthoniobacterales bacterium]
MELSLLRPRFTPEIGRRSDELTQSSQARQQQVLVIGAACVAFLLKLIIAYNTFGTNDVAAFYMFAGSLREHGLEWTYRNGVIFFSNFPVFNHPPLTAYYLELIGALSKSPFLQNCGITFPFLIRLPGIVADFISVVVLMQIRGRIPGRQIPVWSVLLFALSPVSLMVSGFHGNTDPIMTMLLLVSAYMCLRNQPVLCGIFFALSCQIKIIPLLLLPIPLFFWLKRGKAAPFVAAWGLLTVALWIQPLTGFPVLFFRNVIAYSSYWGGWGISFWLKLTHWSQFNGGFFNLPLAATLVTLLLKVGIILGVLTMAWRRRHLSDAGLIDSLACAWLVLFVFAPSISPQYMVWLAPFVLLLSPKLYGWLTVATAVALFFFYNELAGGLPWYIGIARNNSGASSLTAAWMLWPWGILVVGLILFWRTAVFVQEPSETEQDCP